MSTSSPPLGGRSVQFGGYRLASRLRRLYEGEAEVRLGARALDILMALLERPGELVSKEELRERAWPGTFVDDSNLKVQMAALRRSLGDGHKGRRFIETVSGRGYVFVAPVLHQEDAVSTLERETAGILQLHNLPVRATRLVGRDAVVERLSRLLDAQRLVTIVGAGGAGKTAVALAAAEAEIGAHRDGVWLVDLAAVGTPAQAPMAVALALGLDLRSPDPLSELISALRNQVLLLVLDNCEHLIDLTSGLVDRLLQTAPGVRVLATSREPLAVAGERVFPLPPLEGPPLEAAVSASDLLRYPAAQLFVERAAAATDGFELADADAPYLVELCAWVEGLPLGIELLAARTDVFGVRGLAARGADLLPLANRGRRTAAVRHRTLTATFDWSFGLLDEAEQRTFTRLAVFSAGFTLDGAVAVAADEGELPDRMFDLLSSLLNRSLITLAASDPEPRFRFLEPLRAYAMARLRDSEDARATQLRHAEYFLQVLRRAQARSPIADRAMAEALSEIGNVHAAIEWSLSPDGAPDLAVALTVAAGPLWFDRSMYDEASRWAARALSVLERAGPDDAAEMRLLYLLGMTDFYAQGFTDSAKASLHRSLTLSEAHGERELLVQSAYWLSLEALRRRDHWELSRLAEKCEAAADRWQDAVASMTASTILGMSTLHRGELEAAKGHLESVYGRPVDEWRKSHIQTMGVRCDAGNDLARTLWILGDHRRARQVAHAVLADAETLEPSHTCAALAVYGGSIALWAGDLDVAHSAIDRLLSLASERKLHVFYRWGRSIEGAMLVKRGEFVAGVALIRETLRAIDGGLSVWRRAPLLMDLSEGLAGTGEFDLAFAAITESLSIVATGLDGWAEAEVLRHRAEIRLRQGRAQDAERDFEEALTCARRQKARSWELRASLGLARLWLDRGDNGRALDLLSSVRSGFGASPEAADLRDADALLSTLAV